MIKFRKTHYVVFIIMIIVGSLFLSSCAIKDRAANPGEWGFDCVVTYDALSGTINTREVRETYYTKNSYVFKPSGTTNLLIDPVKDGYVLGGWYTAKEDIKDTDGKITGYSFKPEDRWDFDEDRVQEDITLYARWIPQARVDYVDASTDEVKFSKNITAGSSIEPLSSAAEKLIVKKGLTFEGYYDDKGCTVPYDFTEYKHQVLIPSNEDLYAQLYEEFPNYIKKVQYKESSEDELSPEEDNTDLFINKIGYAIETDDQNARDKIRASKDKIYDASLNYYVENASEKVIYLKYSEGNYAQITNVDQLKTGGKVSFSGLDKAGNPIDGYVIMNDIDFKGTSLATAEKFTGKIAGNGYSLKNITISLNSKKMDRDTSKELGLFKELDGASIEDLTLENMNIKLNVNSGIPVTVGALAAKATNTKIKNVKFIGLTMDTGKGDDGAAAYKIGDVFGTQTNIKLDNVTGEDITITSSDSAEINSILE